MATQRAIEEAAKWFTWPDSRDRLAEAFDNFATEVLKNNPDKYLSESQRWTLRNAPTGDSPF
jgi:hypothetical protein